jgi:SAM-dependent methyltransferase
MSPSRELASTDLPSARALAPPRPLVLLVLAAAGLAALAVGGVATAHLLWQVTVPLDGIPLGHWVAMAAALCLTLASLGVRSLRWVFCLRRTQTYVPLRDSIVIYLAGLSLVFVPFLAGETLLRAIVARERRVADAEPILAVNYWERALDLIALCAILGATTLVTGGSTSRATAAARWWAGVALAPVAMSLLPRVRRALLTVTMKVARLVARLVFDAAPVITAVGERRLIGPAAYGIALTLSIVAWILPGLGLWGLARAWDGSVSVLQAQAAFAGAGLLGGVLLAPGGVFVVGASILVRLEAIGVDPNAATLIVFGLRLATVGFAVALGLTFVGYHRLRRQVPSGAAHFDSIAEVYDAQIPEARRAALLRRKTELMDRILEPRGRQQRGLDVGCGQGHYVVRMRELGYDVVGIDDSPLQVARAHARLAEPGAATGDRPPAAGGIEPPPAHRVGPGLVTRGSVLEIPCPDGRFDFAYCINVLHHLDSFESQRRAFAELGRVLKPGGLLFLHEINTRNWLFRFYMGYLFPALNCIDEGVERWLLPHRLGEFTDLPQRGIEYFTFLPDFVPLPIVRRLAPLERRLEASRFGKYSAHYVAVFEKPREAA